MLGVDLRSITPLGAFRVLGRGSCVRSLDGWLRDPPSVGLATGWRPACPLAGLAVRGVALPVGDTTVPGDVRPRASPWSLSVGRGAVRTVPVSGARTEGRAVLVGVAGELAPGREGARTPPLGRAVRPVLPQPGIARGFPCTVGREGAGDATAPPRRCAVRPAS